RRAGWHVAVLVALIAVTVVWNTLAFEHQWNATLTKSLPAWLGEFALGMLVAHWIVRREHRDPTSARMRAGTTALIAAAGAAVVLACGYWNSTRWLQGDVSRSVAIHLVFAVGFALIIAALTAG